MSERITDEQALKVLIEDRQAIHARHDDTDKLPEPEDVLEDLRSQMIDDAVDCDLWSSYKGPETFIALIVRYNVTRADDFPVHFIGRVLSIIILEGRSILDKDQERVYHFQLFADAVAAFMALNAFSHLNFSLDFTEAVYGLDRGDAISVLAALDQKDKMGLLWHKAFNLANQEKSDNQD